MSPRSRIPQLFPGKYVVSFYLVFCPTPLLNTFKYFMAYFRYADQVKVVPDGDMKSILGGKGANIAKMRAMGITVPPGFTITTEVC